MFAAAMECTLFPCGTRCLFETYFTLDAAEGVKRQVLESLIVVSERAAPGLGLEALGGALMRRTAETGDEDAAFFLSSVPPTVRQARFFWMLVDGIPFSCGRRVLGRGSFAGQVYF